MFSLTDSKTFGEPSCPKCRQALIATHFSSGRHIARFNLICRTCYGWCEHCKRGVEIEQYQRYCTFSSSPWLVLRWRSYSNHAKPRSGKWHVVRELPVPVLETAPDAGYDKLAFPADKFKQEYECEFVGANG